MKITVLSDYRTTARDPRLIGAKKLLLEGLGVGKDESLLIYADEPRVPVAMLSVKAAKELGIENLTLIVNPSILRPRKNAPKALLKAFEITDALLWFVDRIPEEATRARPYRREIQKALKETNIRYIRLIDTKPEYFDRGGIYADYDYIEEQGKRLFKPLKDCKLFEISSKAGTDLSFQLRHEAGILYRGPSLRLTQEHEKLQGLPMRLNIEAPEGEGGCPPLMNTVNGTIVSDGAITGMGIPPRPIKITFKDGKNINVEGDEIFLEEMKDYIERLSGSKPKSLLCLDWINEFSIGINKWSKFDDNKTNCEKVAGSIHFGIGNAKLKDEGHGEYFDFMLNHPTIIVTKADDTKLKIIENGKILI